MRLPVTVMLNRCLPNRYRCHNTSQDIGYRCRNNNMGNVATQSPQPNRWYKKKEKAGKCHQQCLFGHPECIEGRHRHHTKPKWPIAKWQYQQSNAKPRLYIRLLAEQRDHCGEARTNIVAVAKWNRTINLAVTISKSVILSHRPSPK